ncbi:sensor histidine kinase [Allokutzneria sp. NRRL B-24872]|uniref:sensor histidine kinase n=1 Tax=Allokutzneria sp. NRRL B-24872 TaxID=1137961 RepID=UPI00143DABF3|nr:sensor histidine kinase [Allokutzneria sp. NRRL B-24872]
MSAPPIDAPLKSLAKARFLFSAWPWRALAHVLTTPFAAAAAIALLAFPALPWIFLVASKKVETLTSAALLAALGAVLVGLFGALLAPPLAEFERRRLGLLDRRPIVSGHRGVQSPGLATWLRTRYTEAATWRELAYVLLLAIVAPMLYGALAVLVLIVVVIAASPLLLKTDVTPLSFGTIQLTSVAEATPYAIGALVLVPALPYLWTALAGAHASVARHLLCGAAEDELRVELAEVSRSRARLVNAFEVERRRIERDLHDGAQQRLVSLTLQLGLARIDLPAGSAAAQSVGEAHDQAKQLMTELRELINGIHPQVLTDRGLVAALQELASRSGIPVTVDADVPTRPQPYVEATAYFVVAEALANVAKHSGASAVTVRVRQLGGRLEVVVSDNGRGGADPRAGTGLTGLADRVSVIDGTMTMSSPVGGPTVLTVELPCT